MIIILLLLGLGSALVAAFSKLSLIVIYLLFALGFSSLLMVFMFLGFFDQGGHHTDTSLSDSSLSHDSSLHHDYSDLFMISPMTILTSGALFGSYGLITLPLLSFLPPAFRDYISILISLFLTGFSYLLFIRNLFRFLKTTSIAKSKYFFEGKEGNVIEAIFENGVGKIAINIGNEVHYLYVRTEDGRSIPVGRKVRVKRVIGDYGYVEEI